MWSRVPRALLATVVAATLAVACSDDEPTSPPASPLSGLVQSESRDSVGNSPPPPPQTPTPGYFRGRVLGQSDPQSGQVDTLGTAPRVAGVQVVAYPRVSNAPMPEVGPAAGSTVTDAEGEFQLPELPHGEYVVTFTPPAASEYKGVWVTTTAHSNSHEHLWWVVLPKK